MTVSVWAPLPRRVRLSLDGAVSDMTRDEHGWWHSPLDAPADSDYGFLLDDDEAVLPDPRSRRQPGGVHEASRVVDLDAHEWSDAAWTGRQLPGSVVYELHIGTFTPEGTLDSAIERLDHLVSLGVDLVEVLPVNAFNGEHNWGYDGVLWSAVTESYGGPAAYQRFVDACHQRGLGVIQDVVYNHLGPSGNYLPRFAPYLASEGGNTWGQSLNLDGEGSDEVRRYILDSALLWFRDFHVDGLRLDAVHALVDISPTHLLKQLSLETDALSAHLRRPLTLIAESDMNDPTLITPREGGGYGLTAQWSDDYHHALHVNLTRETVGYYEDFDSLAALAKVWERGFFHDGTWSSFREREHGSPIDTAAMPTWRLVTYAQDHDQIGNRATGDRLSASLDDGLLEIAAVLTMLTPFTPMLFQGEEWAASTPWQFFTSHPEPELGAATAEGRIAEFARMGWDPSVVPDPQDPESFHRSKLDWAEAEGGRHARLLSLYRELGSLRRSTPVITAPSFEGIRCDFDEDARWFVVRRPGVTIAVNFGDADAAVEVPGEVLLATGGARPGLLPPHSALVVAT
jgi:maltooligosyltrehalose trehalohydrolase